MYIRDSGSFEDAMQEGRLAILGCIRNYDLSSPAYFEGYVKMAVIYTIRNLASKHREDVSLEEEITEEGGCLHDILDSGVDIEEDEIKNEELRFLKAALDRLSEKDGQVINEFYFEGKSMREMSKGRRCHYMTVVKQKERALQGLRENLCQ